MGQWLCSMNKTADASQYKHNYRALPQPTLCLRHVIHIGFPPPPHKNIKRQSESATVSTPGETLNWAVIPFSYWVWFNTCNSVDCNGLSQRLGRRLQSTNNHPESLCSRREEGLQACKLQSLVGKEGEGQRAPTHSSQCWTWPLGVATHTHHVTAVNCVCLSRPEVCMQCVCVSNIIYTFKLVWLQSLSAFPCVNVPKIRQSF